MKYLLAVNGLVALGFLQHEFHERVASWVHTLAARGAPDLATCFVYGTGLRPGPRTGTAVWIHHRPRANPITPPQDRKILNFAFIPDDDDVSHIPALSRRRSKLPAAISHNSPRRRAQFLRRWMKEYAEHF